MAGGFLESLLGKREFAAQPPWLAVARQRASDALARDGLPDARNEAWKYTSLRALGQRTYAMPERGRGKVSIDASAITLPDVDGPRLVFVDGVFRAHLSRMIAQSGLVVTTLSEAMNDDADALRSWLDRDFDGTALAFARLNAALVEDGAVIRVAAGSHVPQALHLVHFGTAAANATVAHSRVLIDVGEDASVSIVEHHLGEAGEANLFNGVTQVALGARCRLGLLQLQVAADSSTRIRRTEAMLGADALLDLHSVELGAALSRHDLVVHLAGDRSRLQSRGVFALRGRQHGDTRIDVRHRARDTRCDLLWRGVADQRARGVFHGGITVEAGADGADAKLSNKNLLLSEQAEIDTQPVLEIHADEVKAAHGATVGQLDDKALFYLRSRGLSQAQARSMLTLAFCRVAVDSLEPAALREHVGALLLERLPSGSDAGTSA